jgi:hypothetical protein
MTKKTDNPTRTTFGLAAQSAILQHVNLRKEGPEDNRVPACDLKFQCVAPADVLLAFSDSLRSMLYTSDGQPRYPQMGDVEWDVEMRNYLLDIVVPPRRTPLELTGVKLKNFKLRPLANWRLDLTFSAQAYPANGTSIADQLHRALMEDVKIDLKLNGDLLAGAEGSAKPKPPESKASAPADLVDAVDPGGELLGFKLKKSENLVLTIVERDGKKYRVVGQGENYITLAPEEGAAPEPVFKEPPELTDEIKAAAKAAGKVEGAKPDGGDLEKGMEEYLRTLDKDLVEEHRAELESEYVDGYEAAG